MSFAHLLSVSKIPEIIEKSIYINSIPNEDPKNNGKIEAFDYYFIGLKIDGKDYTAKVVVAKNSDGQKYYDHALSKIEKGKLIDLVRKQTSLSSHQGFPNDVIDNRLISLLQENNSENAHFSFADRILKESQRRQAIILAKKLYSRLGKGWDASNPLKPAEYPRPTEDDREEIAMSDMSFLDEDIDFICDRAEAILAQMLARPNQRNILDAVPKIELNLEQQRIFDSVANLSNLRRLFLVLEILRVALFDTRKQPSLCVNLV